MAEELITIFVALELLSVCLYVLTAFRKDRRRSTEAGLKYFLFGGLSSAFLYYGLSLLYGATGTTLLPELASSWPMAEGLSSLTSHGVAATALVLLLVGLGFKIALVPFHLWAPDAYEEAPTPITGFISTVSKAASFYLLLKILFVGFPAAGGSAVWPGMTPGWSAILAVLAGLSMTLGNLVAMQQRNVKRLLAYSSIAHGGYVLVGVVAASTLGIASALYYVIVYALTNLGAFGIMAIVAPPMGGEQLDDLAGLGKRTPLLSLLMVCFVLSLAGIPPLAGFVAKFAVFLAAAGPMAAPAFGLMWLVVLAILNSAVSLYYYFQILKRMYVIEPRLTTPIRLPFVATAAIVLTGVAVVLLGVFPGPLLSLLTRLAGSLPL